MRVGAVSPKSGPDALARDPGRSRPGPRRTGAAPRCLSPRRPDAAAPRAARECGATREPAERACRARGPGTGMSCSWPGMELPWMAGRDAGPGLPRIHRGRDCPRPGREHDASDVRLWDANTLRCLVPCHESLDAADTLPPPPPLLWDTSTLCCLVPRLPRRESPPHSTLTQCQPHWFSSMARGSGRSDCMEGMSTRR